MTVAEFVNLVRLMREAQKAYFKSRSQDRLAAAKAREADVDAALASGEIESLPQQGELFAPQTRTAYEGGL